MKQITVTYNVYAFDELSDQAKAKAVGDFIDIMIESPPYSDNLQKAIDESERMQTPWFLGEYALKYCEKEIMEELARCAFLEDGSGFGLLDVDKNYYEGPEKF